MDVLNPIQVLPVNGNWRAAFVHPDTKEIYEKPVISWALCSTVGAPNTIQGMVHLDTKIVAAGECPNFVGYLQPGVSRGRDGSYVLNITGGVLF